MIDEARFDALLLSKQAVMAASLGDMGSVYDAVMDTSLAAVPTATGAFIQLLERDQLVVRAGSGNGSDQLGRRIPVDRSFAGHAIRIGKAMRCDDIERIADVDIERYRRAGMRSVISVPLIQRDEAIGTLKFYAPAPNAFEYKDVTIAQLVAAQIMSGLMIVAERAAVGARRESEARFKALTDALTQGLILLSPGATISYTNAATRNFLLWKPGSAASDPLSLVAPEDRDLVDAFWASLQHEPMSRDIECRIIAHDGSIRWVMLRFVPVHDDDDRLIEWLVTAIDIDSHKTMEIELREAIKVQDLLLREVHHRVKNSLQIATGLLAIQADRVSDPEARGRLLNARAQISTIAQVHKSIYRGSRHDLVEFSALLRNLVRGLVGEEARRRVWVALEAPETAYLPIDRAVPLALVAGEIVTNALKYGKPATGKQRLSITLAAAGTSLCLDIADNGSGFPGGFAPETSDGLGMEIILGLVAQAGGTIRIMPASSGAHLQLVVPGG